MTSDSPPVRTAGPRRLRALLALPALVAAVAVVVLLLELRRTGDLDAERQAALQAARQQAVNLTSIDHRTAERDIDRVLALATGELAEQFEREQEQLAEVLQRNRAASEGEVLGAGLVQLDDRAATALVAVDAFVTTAENEGGAPTVQRYRMSIDLRRVGDRWLAERVLFAGAPS